MSQHSHIAAVGIDLGTTFSVIAHLDSAGRPCTIPNSEGDLITPSVVFFDGDNPVVGKEAVKAAVVAPEDVAQFMKRDMGCAVYPKPIHGEHLPPEVIQSFILDKLRRDAALKLGEFSKVVITVPAFFNEPRRKATQDAGSLAGLDVIDIINEPTAAAIAFGVQEGFLTAKGESKQAERIVIYDLGGGTFDVTLMEIDGRHYNAIATAGDVCLGGIDWDRRIVDYVAEQFSKKNGGLDPRQNPAGMQRLLREAEDAKRTLSTRDQTAITFEHAGNAIRVPLARQQFEEMTADLLERTRFTVTNLLQDAGVKWDNITRLLLVGGSTRMPMVQRMVEQVSGKKPDRSLSADESVAHGAAIYAGLILASEAGSRPEFRVRNVNSHNLGVLGIEKATGRHRNQVMIPRNTSLPVTRTSCFVTHRVNQTNVAVNVVEGGDASGNDATAIGKCVVRDLPANLPAGTPVEVTFEYGQDGRLKVKARLPNLDKEATSEIERASGMTADMLREWNQRLRETDGLHLSAAPGAASQQKSPPSPSSFDDSFPLPSPADQDKPPELPQIARQGQPPELPVVPSSPTVELVEDYPTAEEPPELSVVPSSPTGSAWFYAKDGVRHGPFTDANVKELATCGQLARNDLVWKEGMSQWAEARTINELFPAPTGTQSPPSVPAASGPPPIPASAPSVPLNPFVIEDAGSAGAISTPSWSFEQSSGSQGPKRTSGMQRAGGTIALIAGVFSILAAFATLLVGGLGRLIWQRYSPLGIPSATPSKAGWPQSGKPCEQPLSAWHSWISVAALSVGCFPVGLYLLWTHPRWSGQTKKIWTGVWLALLCFGIMSNHSKRETVPQPEAQVAQTETHLTTPLLKVSVSKAKEMMSTLTWSLTETAAKNGQMFEKWSGKQQGGNSTIMACLSCIDGVLVQIEIGLADRGDENLRNDFFKCVRQVSPKVTGWQESLDWLSTSLAAVLKNGGQQKTVCDGIRITVRREGEVFLVQFASDHLLNLAEDRTSSPPEPRKSPRESMAFLRVNATEGKSLLSDVGISWESELSENGDDETWTGKKYDGGAVFTVKLRSYKGKLGQCQLVLAGDALPEELTRAFGRAIRTAAPNMTGWSDCAKWAVEAMEQVVPGGGIRQIVRDGIRTTVVWQNHAFLVQFSSDELLKKIDKSE